MVGKSEAVGFPQMEEEPRLFPSDYKMQNVIIAAPGGQVTTDL